jgi:hypothetical protein
LTQQQLGLLIDADAVAFFIDLRVLLRNRSLVFVLILGFLGTKFSQPWD